ncbi:MAG: hypothetical protein U0414_02340 [Polyangiaceae bacterium]
MTPNAKEKLTRALAIGRHVGVAVLLLAAMVTFVLATNFHYKVKTWLFWHYAGYWLTCLGWGLGCLSTGYAIVKRLLPPQPLREAIVLAFATGAVAYYLLSSTLGLFYLYRPFLFFALPGAMIAAGAWDLFKLARRLRGKLARARAKAKRAPAWALPVIAFGLVGFALVYFPILVPENVQFDSRWKHFALAEEYVVTHGIRRFPEGWTVETNPHLATFVYLQGFLLPFGELFDRVELAAHLEFFVFIVSTLSIPVLVRRLVPGVQGRYTWVVRFLFPGVFVYDSSLTGGADHIAALFVVPIALLLIKGLRDLSWRYLALFAAMLGGAAMVKLTCLLMFAPVGFLAIGVRVIQFLVRPPSHVPHARRAAIIAPLAAIAAGLLVTSTFWAKNWVWYGDPIYPSLFKKLTLRPWTEDAPDLFIWGYQDYQFWRPSRDLAGVWETLKAVFSFAFIPHDYSRNHGAVPVFGSLFTLLIPCLVFLKKTKRIWMMVAIVDVAIFTWYWIHHQDRYLQPLVPWMAAATAATIILLFRLGWVGRIGSSLLVGYQIIWGGDAPFLPTHAMAGAPMKASYDLLSSGFRKDANRFRTYANWVALGNTFPRNARVVLHDNHTHLGFQRETLNDWGAWQFGVSYGRLGTPQAVWKLLKEMGVTHVSWEPQKSKGWDSIAGDIVFFEFATRETDQRGSGSGFEWGTMKPSEPTAQPIREVAFLGCNNTVQDGLYHLADLHVPVFGPNNQAYPEPRMTGAPAELLAKADAVVVDPKCPKSGLALTGFELVAHRKNLLNFGGTKELVIYLRVGGSLAPTSSAPGSPSQDDADHGD